MMIFFVCFFFFSCLDVYYEYTNSPHFLECINYEDFLYDLDYPELFCEDDCVNYLDQAVAAITRACGFPPFQASIIILNYR